MLNKFSIPLTPTVIAASGTFSVVLDLYGSKYKRLLIIQDWLNGTTNGVTGLQLSILNGFGPANKMPDDVAMLKFATLDPTVVFQPALAQPVINLAAAASPANQYNTFVALDEDYVSRFPKLYFVNLDAGKAMTLSIWGDE